MGSDLICIITIDDNRYCTLKSTNSGLDKIEREFTSIDYSKCFVYGKFRKELAVKVPLLIRKENTPLGLLSIGLLDRLISFIKKEGGRWKITDSREFNTYNFTDDVIKNILHNKDNDIILRDYQVDALNILLDNHIGVIKAGTGSGKTEIFTALCKLTDNKTLILFKEIKLAHQTMERMKGAQVDAGIVQGGNIDEDHNVVMCTVQSAHKLQRKDYEMVIVDECHNSAQNRYQNILSAPFKYRFGFSATPFGKNKHKNTLIERWLGNILFDVAAKKLVDEGHLARPIITFIKIDRVIKDVIRKGKTEAHEVDIFELKWQAAEKNGIVKNQHRNRIIKLLANHLPGTVLTLVKYVDSHGVKLHEQMEDALFLSGKDKLKERNLAVEMLENNKIKTIIASTIFDEGIDIKNIFNVIMAGGGKSYEKTLQRIGRGMRILKDKDGNVIKDTVHVFDFYDETHPILLRHSKERVKYCKEEGYDVKIISIKELKLP